MVSWFHAPAGGSAVLGQDQDAPALSPWHRGRDSRHHLLTAVCTLLCVSEERCPVAEGVRKVPFVDYALRRRPGRHSDTQFPWLSASSCSAPPVLGLGSQPSSWRPSPKQCPLSQAPHPRLPQRSRPCTTTSHPAEVPALKGLLVLGGGSGLLFSSLPPPGGLGQAGPLLPPRGGQVGRRQSPAPGP